MTNALISVRSASRDQIVEAPTAEGPGVHVDGPHRAGRPGERRRGPGGRRLDPGDGEERIGQRRSGRKLVAPARGLLGGKRCDGQDERSTAASSRKRNMDPGVCVTKVMERTAMAPFHRPDDANQGPASARLISPVGWRRGPRGRVGRERHRRAVAPRHHLLVAHALHHQVVPHRLRLEVGDAAGCRPAVPLLSVCAPISIRSVGLAAELIGDRVEG